MRLAVAIASTSAQESAFVVWRGFKDAIRKASEYGYQGVELALKTAKDINTKKLNKWLTTYSLEVSCINTGQIFSSLGLYFTHPDSSARKRLIEIYKGLVNLAADYGKFINVGRTRGFYDDQQEKGATIQRFVEVARTICDYGQSKGVTLLIEPVNRYEINFVNTVGEGVEILQLVERENLGLMPDVFHMNIEDNGIGQTLSQYGSYVKYVHLADSNRCAPGTGHIDFKDVFAGLMSAGFDGWTSIEILPKPDADTAARKAAQVILPMIAEYNKVVNIQKR